MTEISKPNWWVVTDLDGTLMDHHYDWSAAMGAIRCLQRHRIPVIPCTSKTAEEVLRFRELADLHDPFIVENGGAIYGESANGQLWQQDLGPSWRQLRPQLADLQHELGEPLLALDDLSEADAVRLLGLSGEALKQAQRRQCSVPFVPPKTPESRHRLQVLAEMQQLCVVQGNRMGHLLGAGVSKGRALQTLKQRLGASGVKVLTLGDSPNDLPLLEAGDSAVVVPGPAGVHPELQSAVDEGRFHLAPAPHAEGWSVSVLQLIPGLQGFSH
ncbi:HAD-IIB family hydrolase [Synechococcus sp. MIT S9503]|uniref:HAD-IIB family hydrolase n=1 Tax=Synechococcus sp. MIT S9503 TaxID=3082547 RepID=UPI0039A564CC